MIHKEKLLHRIPAPFVPAAFVKLVNKFEKIILYGMIGGFAVVIDVGLFWLIDATTEVPIVLNNAISIGVAMVYSFLMNAFFNFRTRSGLLRRFFSFAAVTCIGFLASSLLLSILSEAAGLNSVLAKNLTLPMVFIVQFTLNSKFTFKAEKDHEDRVLESIA
jgi:putative flippase GtrA